MIFASASAFRYTVHMNLVVRIPDKLASRLSALGPDLEREALEALVLENYRAGLMTVEELREALGFEVLDEVDGFLKTHGVYGDYSMADLERERRTLAEFSL